MAFTTSNVPHHATFNASYINVFAHVVNWVELRKTRRELSALSDRELDDIGLTRTQVANLTLKDLHR